MKKIKLIIVMVCGLSLISTAALKPGQLSEVRRNAKSSEECINGFTNLLYDEIQNPTVTHKGWGGGYVTHDYIMNQFVTAFLRVVNYYDYTVNKWIIDHEAFIALKKATNKQSNPSAKLIMQIALGLCGDRSVVPSLITSMQYPLGSNIRIRVISTLAKLNAVEAIPDMIELINDSTTQEKSESCLFHNNMNTAVYPIRRAARYAILHFKVNIYENKKYKPDIDRWESFTVNTNSAIQVLTKELNNISDDTNRSKALLHAISRVGGEYSRKALEDYIDKNKTLPDKKELVATAEDLLNKVEVNKTK